MTAKPQAQSSKTPKEYRPPMSPLWWTKNTNLVLFMVRELSSVFAGGYVVYLLVLLSYVRSGNDSAFYRMLTNKFSIALQLVALIFVTYHSVTWFNLTPKIMVIWRGEEKVSPVLIAGFNYALWLIMSIVVVFFIFPPLF